MTHLFTYGSLMFEDVWNRLVKGNYLSQKAMLANGYARRCVKDDVYLSSSKPMSLSKGSFITI